MIKVELLPLSVKKKRREKKAKRQLNNSTKKMRNKDTEKKTCVEEDLGNTDRMNTRTEGREAIQQVVTAIYIIREK